MGHNVRAKNEYAIAKKNSEFNVVCGSVAVKQTKRASLISSTSGFGHLRLQCAGQSGNANSPLAGSFFAFDKTPQLRPLFPSPQLGKTCTFNMSRANHSCAGPFSECFLSILLYQALNVRINSWTFCNPSHTLPLSLCHSFCRKDYPLHFMMKIIRLLHTYSKEQAVPFYSSCPTTRGHCRTVKRYQTLRNILHSGRRLSSAPPSLPADKIRHRLPPGGRLKNGICSPP